MRKRVRKKIRRGEFAEHGFGVQYTLVGGLSQTEIDDFLGRFLEHAIEAQNLGCGGGGQNDVWDFFVTKSGRGSPSDAQRTAVGAWLAEQSEVVSYTLGEFVDAWHGPEEALVVNPANQFPFVPTTQAPGDYNED